MGDHVLMVPAKMSGKIKNAFASCKPRGKGVKTFTVPLLLTMRHHIVISAGSNKPCTVTGASGSA